MTMIRDGLGFASYFSVFNALTHSHSHSFGGILMIGGLTGSFSWFISYPFDVIKTHIQMNHSFNDIMSKLRTNSMQFLFKGLFITLLRAFLVNSMTFTTVHYILIHCDWPVIDQLSTSTQQNIRMTIELTNIKPHNKLTNRISYNKSDSNSNTTEYHLNNLVLRGWPFEWPKQSTIECQLNVKWMSTECQLNVNWKV